MIQIFEESKMKKQTLGILLAILALLSVNVVLAALYIQKDVSLTGGVTVEGNIEVYGPDGVSVLTAFDFPTFDGGVSQGWLYQFYVNNTGNQPVSVAWNLSSSSISWEKNATSEYYLHYEDVVYKYHFGVYQDIGTTDFWMPDTESIVLAPGEGVELAFMLGYTGEPVTEEAFSIIASFYAYST
jgi:hypothetical protein